MRTRVVILALMAFVAAGIWIAKSNYDGVCFWTGKRLTDRERLELAFNRALLRASGKFPVKAGTDEIAWNKDTMNWDYSPEWHEEVGYKSFDEYVGLYPDCCKIKWLGHEKAPFWPEPTFWQRISGDYGFGVEFEARDRFRRQDGTWYAKRRTIHPYFTNCGAKSPEFLHGG